MKSSTAIVRFNTGVVSPMMTGRVDTEEYAGACSVLDNFIPTVQGAAIRRGGTRFVAAAKYADKKVRLFSFQFSSNQPYLTEFGDKYVRFFLFRHPIVNEDGSPFEIETPYKESDLDALSFAQSGDVMFIAHPNYPLHKLVRYSNTDWRLTEVELTDGPYLPVNTGEISLSPSGTAGSVTITASAALFCESDVGRHVRIMHPSNPNVKWGAAKITEYVSEVSVKADVFADLPFLSTGASKAWRLGALSKTTGYASTVAFFEQRLVLGKGNGVYGSATGKYEIFSPSEADGTVKADNGYGYELSSEQINDICWLSSGRVLAIGTVGADFTLSTAGGEGSLPMTVKVVRHSTYGSEAVAPLKISNTTLFVQRYGRKLRAFVYDSNSDGYVAKDMTTLASHITESGIHEMALQQEPVPVVWCALKNGSLIGMTYEAEESVRAWHTHTMKGAFVESIVTQPSENGSYDELYLSVKRTVAGTERRYIEVMERGMLEESDTAQDCFYVDCGLSYKGEKVKIVGGLEHLEGETVAILADGAVQPERTVQNGKIELDVAASSIHVGLPYVSVLEPTALSGLGEFGVSENAKKRISSLLIRFYKTLGVKAGRKEHTEALVFRRTNDKTDNPPELFTGDRKIPFSGDWVDSVSIRVEQDQPLPVTVLGMFPIVSVNSL